MSLRLVMFVVCFGLTLTFPVGAATPDASWNNLAHITRRQFYTLVQQDRSCLTGKILSVTNNSITLQSWLTVPSNPHEKPQRRVLPRSEVLQVSEGIGFSPRDLLYSARSSWSDIGSIETHGNEQVLVLTKDGKTHTGKLLKTSEHSLTLEQIRKQTQIMKEDVAKLYYLRAKPISASVQYSAQEMFVLDPELLWDLLFLGRMPVLVYDASRPEENSRIQCRQESIPP